MTLKKIKIWKNRNNISEIKIKIDIELNKFIKLYFI